MADPIPITRKFDRKVQELLEAHQTIIDKWYADWLAKQRRQIDEFWANKQR